MKDILYVEDSVASQALMRRFLKGEYEITMATTLAEGSAWLSAKSFDLAIFDVIFPEGTSLDLLATTRRRFCPTTLPIIVVSSSMDRVLRGRVLRLGANEALAKPLNPVEFRALVARMLHEPYVRENTSSLTQVCCFQWSANEQVHQFCPELGVTLSGATPAEISARMQSLIAERLAAGEELGLTVRESVVTHVIDSGAVKPAAISAS